MNKNFKQRLAAAIPLIATFIYLILGFQFGMWGKGVIVFLLIPLSPMILGLKKFIITLPTFIAIIYIVLGIIFGSDWWHPGWIIFLLIPIITILRGNDNNIDDNDTLE